MFDTLDDNVSRISETPRLAQRILRYTAVAAASLLVFGLLILSIALHG
jgi:hypothetical protein